MRIRKKHGVLLEYVLLVCSILPLVFGASAAVYSNKLFSGGFGTVGKAVVSMYQRIVTVISLPIP
ncbi:MAG: hypothetical protein J6W70_00720 [Lentisphaeria bacterium]|nr:hypothetical protein [Lentisphaeria bacterium]